MHLYDYPQNSKYLGAHKQIKNSIGLSSHFSKYKGLKQYMIAQGYTTKGVVFGINSRHKIKI